MSGLICCPHLRLSPAFGEVPHLSRSGWLSEGRLHLKVSVRQRAAGLGAWTSALEICISYLLLHDKLSPRFTA